MKGLIGCEESQAVTKAFRNLGHEFYSCDLQECSGGHPEWHYKDDVFHVLSRYDNLSWDFIGFHPDCTYLTNSGVRWLFNSNGSKNMDRWMKLEEAIRFFNICKNIIKSFGVKGYIENPIPHKYARDGFISVIDGKWVEGIGKYNQLIQPYQFGHLEKKATCLWLFDVPELKSTKNVYDEMMKLNYKDRAKIHYCSPGKERAKIRSKTYEGIANAIADQWSK